MDAIKKVIKINNDCIIDIIYKKDKEIKAIIRNKEGEIKEIIGFNI